MLTLTTFPSLPVLVIYNSSEPGLKGRAPDMHYQYRDEDCRPQDDENKENGLLKRIQFREVDRV